MAVIEFSKEETLNTVSGVDLYPSINIQVPFFLLHLISIISTVSDT